eukprot:COSAG01_NODE_54414_length_332_cov_0.669528_1_plen_42_part_01
MLHAVPDDKQTLQRAVTNGAEVSAAAAAARQQPRQQSSSKYR